MVWFPSRESSRVLKCRMTLCCCRQPHRRRQTHSASGFGGFEVELDCTLVMSRWPNHTDSFVIPRIWGRPGAGAICPQSRRGILYRRPAWGEYIFHVLSATNEQTQVLDVAQVIFVSLTEEGIFIAGMFKFSSIAVGKLTWLRSSSFHSFRPHGLYRVEVVFFESKASGFRALK